MNKYISLMFIIGLVLLAGCKNSATPTGMIVLEQEEDLNETRIVESNVTEVNNIDTKPEEEEKTKVVALQMYNNNMQFFPKTLTISVGDTVKWVNNLDYLDKTVDVAVYAHHNNLFRSEYFAYGDSFEYTFTEEGKVTYSSLPYPKRFRTGTIIIG